MDKVIGLNYTAAVHQSAGIGRYVRELTAALVQQHSDADLRLFVAGATSRRLPDYPGRACYATSIFSERNHNRLWQLLRLPIPIDWWTGPIDLYHETDYSLPHTRPSTRTIITIHDLAFEHYPDETMPGMLDYLRTVTPRSVNSADHIIAVSEATRRDLIDLYQTSPDRITVIPHGVAPRFQPTNDTASPNQTDIHTKYGLPATPFILTVGTVQPRKNHIRLVQAVQQLKDVSLVIAGGEGWYSDQLLAEINHLNLSERVIITGFIDDADLPALYRSAAVFAFPALYEGFGLPVLEAMASGLPVVTSNTSALPEVVGDAGLLVDPLDVDELAAGLARLLSDSSLRNELRQKGLDRASSITWGQAADAVWHLYNDLLT